MVNSPIDETQLLKRCCGLRALVERVLEQFHTSLEGDLARLLDSLERQDLAQIARVAHRFKGAALNVAAQRLAALLSQLEQAALEGRQSSVHELCAAVTCEGTLVRAYLDQRSQSTDQSVDN